MIEAKSMETASKNHIWIRKKIHTVAATPTAKERKINRPFKSVALNNNSGKEMEEMFFFLFEWEYRKFR